MKTPRRRHRQCWANARADGNRHFAIDKWLASHRQQPKCDAVLPAHGPPKESSFAIESRRCLEIHRQTRDDSGCPCAQTKTARGYAERRARPAHAEREKCGRFSLPGRLPSLLKSGPTCPRDPPCEEAFFAKHRPHHAQFQEPCWRLDPTHVPRVVAPSPLRQSWIEERSWW